MTDLVLLASQLAAAIEKHQPLPEFPAGLSLDEGYAIQRLLVSQLEDEPPAGLKAGVTSAALQEIFQVDHALLGCLYSTGQLSAGARVQAEPKLAIECEIGIMVDGGGAPISAGPAVELVRADFTRREDVTAANLVASNLAADRFVVGESQPWRSSYDDIVVRLLHDGELVNEASLLESLNGPARALDWMRQEAERRNMTANVDRLFMTGTCGSVVPAQAGHYIADYGDLGSVSFTIFE